MVTFRRSSVLWLMLLCISQSDQRQRARNVATFQSGDSGPAPKSRNMVEFQCENKIMRLKCAPNHVLRIVRANYGRFIMRICNEKQVSEGWDMQCFSRSSQRVVAQKCSGRNMCLLNVSNDTFDDYCPNTSKYLEVTYHCDRVPTEPPPPTTTPKPPTTTAKMYCYCNENGSLSRCADSYGLCRCRTNISGYTCDRCRPGFINFPHCIPAPTSPTARTTTATTSPDTTLRGKTTLSQRYCDQSTVADASLVWPRTAVGKSALVECPPNRFGFVSWRCGPNGWIGQPDYGDCKSNWIVDLEDSKEMSKQQLKVLENATGHHVMEPADIKLAVSMLQGVSKKIDQSRSEMRQVANSIVKTGSNILKSRQSKSWTKLEKADRVRVVTKLVVTMETTGFKIADSARGDDTVKMSSENILMEVKVIETASKDADTFADINLPSATEKSGPWHQNTDSITIPRENIDRLSDDGKVKVVFLTYNNLASMLNTGESDLAQGSDPRLYSNINKSQQWVINTNIISTSINSPKSSFRLTKPVQFTLTHKNASLNFEPVCSFWNYSDSTYLGSWSSSGCDVVSRLSNLTHTTCECDHLTNFAVLMDIHGTTRELSVHHSVTLEVITYAGCIISIVALLLSFLTFALFKNLQCDRNTIHKNFVLCLMVAEIIFLSGIHQNHNRVLCSVIAAVLHFLFLCCFAWMCLEGVHLYVMLIEVFEAERSRRLWYYLFGYGLPVLVVTVSASVHHEGYGTELYCWLRTDTYFIWSFVGPVAAVITVNIAMLSLAVYMMCRHSSTTVPMASKQHSTIHKYSWETMRTLDRTVVMYRQPSVDAPMVKGAAVLVILLGLTWAFGILFIDTNTVVMAYIFTVLNSLQGLAIFVFHCLLNEKVKKEYHKYARHATWLPMCIRQGYGGYDSQTTSPNQSSSTGNNYFTRLWSKRKRASGSFIMKPSPTRDGTRRPDSYSRESTLLTPGSNQNGFTFHNGHTSWRPAVSDHGGINGDLSLADCSVINSESVSEYFQNGDARRRARGAYAPDDADPEPLYAEIDPNGGDVNHYLSVDVITEPPLNDGYEVSVDRTYSNNCDRNDLPPVKSPSDDSLKRIINPDAELFVRGTAGDLSRESYRKAIANPQYAGGTDSHGSGRESLNPLLGDFVDDRYPGDFDATLHVR